VIYFLCCWRWKRKFLNKLKRSLVTVGEIIIFSPTMRQEGSGWNADTGMREVVYNYYSDAQVFETLRMCEMFWCLLSQFLCDKSDTNNKYLNIRFAISSTNWKQNNSVARAAFLLRVVWILSVMQRWGVTHDTLIVEPLPSVNLQFQCVSWKIAENKK